MEEKVKLLYEKYVDACTVCTNTLCDCDECDLNLFIKDLEEILKVNHEVTNYDW